MERLRVVKGTVQRMARDGRLSTYHDPRDRWVGLAQAEDVERIAYSTFHEA